MTVSKIVFSGGGSMLLGLVQAASSVFHAEIFIADPFAKIEAPAFLAPSLKDVGPEFAVAIGLALRSLS